jgi:hypothetical protein
MKIQEELAGVTSVTKNFSGIISYAKSYDDVLEDIVEQETIMANNPIGSKKYDEAKAKVDALKQSLADMANQVVLDMFQATIAVGGVTEAELAAYMDMAIDMGYISEEGAAAAMTAYKNAIDTINGYTIDPKTGNITFTVEPVVTITKEIEEYKPTSKKMEVEAELGTTEVDLYEAPIKELMVHTKLDTTEIDLWTPPIKYGSVVYKPGGGAGNAVGGAVQGGNPYTWQEYGYRGELYVPSADGFIMSRADAERALSKALTGANSGDGVDADAVGKAVANAIARAGGAQGGNVYNLTMPTSSNPADVRTAFELMEAWA